jgi:hypothetical protein
MTKKRTIVLESFVIVCSFDCDRIHSSRKRWMFYWRFNFTLLYHFTFHQQDKDKVQMDHALIMWNIILEGYIHKLKCNSCNKHTWTCLAFALDMNVFIVRCSIFLWKSQESKVLEIQQTSLKIQPSVPFETKNSYNWDQRFHLKSKNCMTLKPISLNVLDNLTSYIAFLWLDNAKLHYHYN